MKRNRKGQSTLEFLAMMFLLLGAFLIFQKYIVRAMDGSWKKAGSAWAFGRLYDADETIECVYDQDWTYCWYDYRCFKANGGYCRTDGYPDPTTCQDIIALCATPTCQS